MLWPRCAGQLLDLARKRVGLLLRQCANEPPQRNGGARGTIELQRLRRRKTSVNHPWRIDINVLALLVLSYGDPRVVAHLEIENEASGTAKQTCRGYPRGIYICVLLIGSSRQGRMPSVERYTI